jgi:cutinase
VLVGPLGWLVRIKEHQAHDAFPSAPNYRRRFLAELAVSAVATVMLITIAVLPDARGSAARADACPAVQVVFARGTGEAPGPGRVGEAFVEALRSMVRGRSLAIYAVNYPASRDFVRATDGANDASLLIQNVANTCPDTGLVFGA